MDFSSSINVDIFKSVIECKFVDNNYDPIIESEYRVDEYLTYLFENLMYLLIKQDINHYEAKKLLIKYYGCYKKLGVISIEDEFDKLERQEIESLLIPEHIDTSIKENILVILNMLSNKLNKIIISKLQIYSKEQLLKNLYINASILSYLSIHSNSWDTRDADINQMNLIAEALSIVMVNYKEEAFNFIGTEKKSMEFLIHIILNNDEKFNNKNSDSKDDFIELLVYVRLLIYIEQLINNISIIYDSGSFISDRL